MQFKSSEFIKNVLSSGLSDNNCLEEQRKIMTLNFILLIGISFTIVLGVIAFLQNNVLLGISDFVICIFLIGLYIDLRILQNYNRSVLLGTIIIGFFYFYLMLSGGIDNSAYLWLFTYPSITVILLGKQKGSVASFVFIIILAIVLVFREQIGIPGQYSNNLLIRFFMVYLAVHFIAYSNEKWRSLFQLKMEEANTNLDKANQDKQDLIGQLQKSLDEIRTLQDILPICANCKKIRNDDGYWEQVDQYMHHHTGVKVSHSICPSCKEALYPEAKSRKR